MAASFFRGAKRPYREFRVLGGGRSARVIDVRKVFYKKNSSILKSLVRIPQKAENFEFSRLKQTKWIVFGNWFRLKISRDFPSAG
ncbi:MAG: hypothetical protein C4325_10890 [Blastocatellia bacterium]